MPPSEGKPGARRRCRRKCAQVLSNQPVDPPQTASERTQGRPAAPGAPAEEEAGELQLWRAAKGSRRRKQPGQSAARKPHLVVPCERFGASSLQKRVHLAAGGAARTLTCDRGPSARLAAGWQPCMVNCSTSGMQHKRSRDGVLGLIAGHARECGLQLQRRGGAAMVSARSIQAESQAPAHPCRNVAVASIHGGCHQWIVTGSVAWLWRFVVN